MADDFRRTTAAQAALNSSSTSNILSLVFGHVTVKAKQKNRKAEMGLFMDELYDGCSPQNAKDMSQTECGKQEVIST